MTILKQLFQKLGISESSFLKTYNDFLDKIDDVIVKQKIKQIKPDYIYFTKTEGKNNIDILAVFYDITLKNNFNLKEEFKKIWNLGGIPFIFISSENSIYIYNGYNFDFNLVEFEKIPVGLIEEVWKDFFYFGINKNKLKKGKSVNEMLLINLKTAYDKLQENGLNNLLATKLILKSLFGRYLLDRKIIIPGFEKQFQTKDTYTNIFENKEDLLSFFDILDQYFNGNLFKLSQDEINNIKKEDLKILYSLFSGDNLKTKEKSLFNLYDFSVIPVELLSEIYEQFIPSETKKKDANYHTPLFLVEFLINSYLLDHIKQNKCCMVFDPACGSGVFLVYILKLLLNYNKDNINLENNFDKKIKKILRIVKENIYGLDKSSISIEISKFSIYLAILDFFESDEINKYIKKHFKIFDDSYLNLINGDFFDDSLEDRLPKKVDFIVGNPPWTTKNKTDLHIKFKEKIKKKYGKIINNNQIAQSFLVKIVEEYKDAKIIFILPSKTILYSNQTVYFRKYMLEKLKINEILEFSFVTKYFFKITEPFFVLYADNKIDSRYENEVIHKTFKPNIYLKYYGKFTLEKNDIKKVRQDYLIKFDYLWKILVVGNFLDFVLINKLYGKFKTIGKLKKEKQILVGNGILFSDKKGKEIEEFKNKCLIEGKNFNKFYFKEETYNNRKILRPRPTYKEIFEDKFKLLIAEKLDKINGFSLYIGQNNCLFSHDIIGVLGDKEKLYKIASLLLSKLGLYFSFVLGSYTIVKQQLRITQGDLDKFPIVDKKNDYTNKLKKIIEKLKEIYLSSYSNILENKREIKSLEIKINKIINEVYGLGERDIEQINYLVDVSYPLLYGIKDAIALNQVNDEDLQRYASIFVKHFSKLFQSKNINIEIVKNNYLVLVEFIVSDSTKEIEIIEKDIDYIKRLFSLSEEKFTDDFFVKKDIRGFTKNSFYIIKSNQFKNWHPAIAYIDFLEVKNVLENYVSENE